MPAVSRPMAPTLSYLSLRPSLPEPRTGVDRSPARALESVAGGDACVLLLGLDELGDDCWEVLAAAGIPVMRVSDAGDAVRALTGQAAQVVITDASQGPSLMASVRARRELACAHIIVGVALDSSHEL